jgi:8-oxo-dGTP pyrophosphatase MutT (NUDIX family)
MPLPSGSRAVFRGRWVHVDEEDWPGVGTWEVVRTLDAACVLPITPDDDVLLVRQFRPALRKAILEVPAGLLDVEGEDAATCAARELFEETGYRHTTLERLGGVHTAVGFATEYVHLFLARTEADPLSEPEEGIELVRRPFDEMVAGSLAGQIEDAKTALALLLAAARMPSG